MGLKYRIHSASVANISSHEFIFRVTGDRIKRMQVGRVSELVNIDDFDATRTNQQSAYC
jgi:hypothetical protein